MRPFHGIQELSKAEWWTKRVENAAKIITFIENKQYGYAYLLVHNNPELNLIETLEFKKSKNTAKRLSQSVKPF
ncbi:MAG: hypothetical protein OMM_11621 [Candidatus Magnetoglobus multicellularis str. Araruama]|uniref:Uncharacterized protein n=1 Tax=Candidatus Magnetoglobus multicellularis str. Araruama TaxID=890399 RepID=A0A1V1NXY7_9BACT|nr:MAG: hypothetical protein OMM_11621 [Candidatus Magnetoglobus multicellularis str. Araruama]